MRKIAIKTPWSYVTPEKTIDYPAGEHDVTNDIAEAAEKAGVIEKEEKHGGGSATGGATGLAGAAEKQP